MAFKINAAGRHDIHGELVSPITTTDQTGRLHSHIETCILYVPFEKNLKNRRAANVPRADKKNPEGGYWLIHRGRTLPPAEGGNGALREER